MVNTTARDLHLANGAVSMLILKAAGPLIQDEADSQVPANGIAFGSVIETSGYNLPCSKVYHGACRMWDNGAGQCEKVSEAYFSHLYLIFVFSTYILYH